MYDACAVREPGLAMCRNCPYTMFVHNSIMGEPFASPLGMLDQPLALQLCQHIFRHYIDRLTGYHSTPMPAKFFNMLKCICPLVKMHVLSIFNHLTYFPENLLQYFR